MAPAPGGSDYTREWRATSPFPCYLPVMPYDHSSHRMCHCSSERVLVALCGTLRWAHHRLWRAVLPLHRAQSAADHRTLHLPLPPSNVHGGLLASECARALVGVHTRACMCVRACARARVRTCACVCESACVRARLGRLRASVLASVPCSRRTDPAESEGLAVPHNGAVAARAPRGAGGAAVVPSS